MKTPIERIEEDMLTVITEANELVEEKMWTGEITANQGVDIGRYIREYTATGMQMLSMLQHDFNTI